MAELDAGRFATVLTADPDLQLWPRRSPLFHCNLHQRANPISVNGLKRVPGIDIELYVWYKKPAGIIPANSQRRLGEVVGPKTKEFGSLGNLVGCDRSPRDLDHRSD